MSDMMKAGFARGEINPPLGMAMEGLGQTEGCQSIHDDLFVRALYLTHMGGDVLILGFDLLFFDGFVIDRFKSAIANQCALRPDRIMINTTHTHAGPRVSHWHYSDGPDPAYLDRVEATMLDVVAEAAARRRDVTVHVGQTRTDLPVSRRHPDAQQQARWAPYHQGTVCDALPYCMFQDADDQVVALLFSVSCHPSMIYDAAISADYPGVAIRLLNEHFRTEGSLFLQGAAGDTKPRHVAVDDERWRRGTWADMEAAGAEIAEAVIAHAQAGLAQVAPALRVEMRHLDLPLLPAPDRSQLQAVRDDVDMNLSRRRWAEDMLSQLDGVGELPQEISLQVHVLEFGKGLRLFGINCELVGELGNLVISAFADGVTMPLGYTNGCAIYLPNDRQLPEHGYEVDSYWEYHWPSQLAPGIDEALRRLIRELVCDNQGVR